jgi:hypothetical protein
MSVTTDIDAFFAEASKRDANGTLTIGTTVFSGFYRLLEGEHAGKVVIKSCARIDDKSILFFANSMTWIEVEKLKNVRCERTCPTFSEARHKIDRSKAGWYDDNGKHHVYEW